MLGVEGKPCINKIALSEFCLSRILLAFSLNTELSSDSKGVRFLSSYPMRKKFQAKNRMTIVSRSMVNIPLLYRREERLERGKTNKGPLVSGPLGELTRNRLLHCCHERHHCKQDTCCNCASDDSSNVRTHGMHEQEVLGIRLLANLAGDTGCHRDSRDTGTSDQRIDGVVGVELDRKSVV